MCAIVGLLAFWFGTIAAAWCVARTRRAWGLVYWYRGWEWLAVPYVLAKSAWLAGSTPPEPYNK